MYQRAESTTNTIGPSAVHISGPKVCTHRIIHLILAVHKQWSYITRLVEGHNQCVLLVGIYRWWALGGLTFGSMNSVVPCVRGETVSLALWAGSLHRAGKWTIPSFPSRQEKGSFSEVCCGSVHFWFWLPIQQNKFMWRPTLKLLLTPLLFAERRFRSRQPFCRYALFPGGSWRVNTIVLLTGRPSNSKVFHLQRRKSVLHHRRRDIV